MSMRDRLVDLIINAKREDPETGSFTEFLADCLIQNGVIVPPCKVGDTIYFVCGYNIAEYTVKNMMYDNIFWQFDCENDMYAGEHRNFSFFDERIGKTIFLTRGEAEKVSVYR